MYGYVRRSEEGKRAQWRRAGPGPRPSPEQSKQILFYLAQGAALLVKGRGEDAKAAIDRALALRPEDPQGQCLLANAYFRLGVYPRAIEIWQRLSVTHPSDVTLRVNLSLAFLKTGQPKLALAHLEEAVNLAPRHRRAWRYLGLAYWRLDRPRDAKAAFLQAGHRPMAERMGAMARCALAPTELVTKVQRRQNSLSETSGLAQEVREVLDELSEPDAPLSQDTRTRVGTLPGADLTLLQHGETWQPRETTPSKVALPPPPEAALDAELDRLLQPAYLSEQPELHHGVPETEAEVFRIGAEGELHLSAEHEAYARLLGVRVVRGEFRTQLLPVSRGSVADGFLGGHDPIARWLGPVAAVMRAPADKHFVRWWLSHGEPLQVVESRVWGFGPEARPSVDWISHDGGLLRWLRFDGRGPVVLCVSGNPFVASLNQEGLQMESDALVGWTGDLELRGRIGTEPYSAGAPPLSLSGSGVVFVD